MAIGADAAVEFYIQNNAGVNVSITPKAIGPKSA